MSWDSSLCEVLVMSWTELGIFLSTIMFRPAMGPTHPPLHRVLRVLSLGIKQLEHEADDVPLSSAEVQNVWSFTFAPPYIFMA
jgi:hypothetical protein